MTIRKIYKTTIFLAANFISLFAGALVNLVFIFGDRSRARAQAVITMLWCRAICVILGIKVSKSGQRRRKGGFTVCNHSSYTDIFVMGSLRPTTFLSRHDVRDWPVIGWLARLGGTVFVNRKIKRAALNAMEEIERKSDWGITVVLFPEGTTSNGRSVKAFKSAFFKIPVIRNLPVRPASIRYSSSVVDAVAWHDNKHIAAHFWRLAGIKKIHVSVHFGHAIQPLADWGPTVEARKRLCARAHESVIAGFENNKHRHQEEIWTKK